MIKEYSEYEKMDGVEQDLWWYKILHEKVLYFLSYHKISKDNLIIDLGCGTGGLLQKLTSFGYTTLGIDISEHAIAFCKKKI
jgi:2-polyprenyl-3-methyl-5-hydroxy-6-metoxy-1,4-benzoquinol methylase